MQGKRVKTPGSGRKKGAVNKRTQFVSEVLHSRRFSLIDEVLDRLPQVSVSEQLKALLSLLSYVYPRYTAIQISGEITNPYMDMPMKQLQALVREKILDIPHPSADHVNSKENDPK